MISIPTSYFLLHLNGEEIHHSSVITPSAYVTGILLHLPEQKKKKSFV